MAISNELPIPDPALRDVASTEIVRAWIADHGLHVSLRTAVWDDPALYGIMLCDLMKHIANAYHQNEGRHWQQTCERIKAGFDAEYSAPTDQPTGR